MKSRTNLIFLCLTLLFSALLLVGCGSSSIKIRWRESSGLKHTRANYASFEGVEKKKFRAKDGETIALEGEVTVEKGSLTIELADPNDKILWEQTYTQDGDLSISITAAETGFYTLRIVGDETGGGFDLSWDVED
jgi:hypothetical protein